MTRPAVIAAAAVADVAAVLAGLAVRAGFTGRLPLSFALIVALVLGALLLGWRAVAAAGALLPGRGRRRSA